MIGAALLSGQTVELLHSISHRVICLNINSYFSGSQKFPPWLSTMRYDFEKSFSEAVGQIPSDLLENMMFFSRKSQTAEERMRLLQKCLNARNPAFGSGMPRSWGCDEPGLTSAAGTAQP